MSKTLVGSTFIAGTAICWLFGAVTFVSSLPRPMSSIEREAYLNTLVDKRVTDRDAYEKKFFNANNTGITTGIAFIAGGFIIFGLGQIWLQLSARQKIEGRQ